MKYIFYLFPFICLHTTAQEIKMLASGNNTSLRGVSVVNDKIIWVSGSEGTVGKSLDSGVTWKWIQVKGFEKTDFRDIEAFNETQAVIMGISEPAYILRTMDGGENWKVVFENKLPGMFLDAMEFWNEQSGIVIGDPIDGKFFIARTFDGGYTWRNIPPGYYPEAEPGEACFAASGTNIRKYGNDAACFITGGMRSRIFIRDKKIDLPIYQGKETAGANSLAIKDKKRFIVVGGDFSAPDDTTQICAISDNGGNAWYVPLQGPHGYRSCVEFIDKENWVSCGINGVDITNDDGNTWQWISKEGFNTCRKAKDGKSVFLAGTGGRIGKLFQSDE